ncbi:MAG: MgtC/SapB family protein [Bacteroidetes bacterium]|nr:MgtC/SapB family protein [Bacteroidota bacterium]
MDYSQLITFGISAGLGLLVGLQREFVDKKVAGIRTFALSALLGTTSAVLAQELDSGWIIASGFLAIAILMAVANYHSNNEPGEDNLGQTTEVAALLMFGIGAYLVFGNKLIAVSLGGTLAILLHLKDSLSGWVDRLSPKDLKAIMQFAAISLIILPILPNKNFGPYEVFNPREIWWMVVLITGLSLVGYFAYKWFGTKKGTITSGILGGLISSTATTFTYSGLAKNTPNLSRMVAFVIVCASGVSLIRILVEVAIVSPQHLQTILLPFSLEVALMAALCVALYFFNSNEQAEEIPEPSNPAQLKNALIFGGLYAIILLAVAAARDYFGEGGLLLVSIISGFTDVDAITLSLANTLNRGNLEVDQAWHYMLIAFMSNLVFKGGIVFFTGGKRMRKFVLAAFGIAIAGGILLILLWP